MSDPRIGDSTDDVFYQQVVRYLDGKITADELARFERDLIDNPQKRRLFLDICLQATLIAESAVQLLPGLPQAAHAAPEANDGLREDAHAVPKSRSPVLGFLDGVRRIGAGHPQIAAALCLIMALFASGSLTILVGMVLTPRGLNGSRISPEVAQQPAVIAPRPQPPIAAPSLLVARVARTYGCAWADPETAPTAGDGLKAGQPLMLRSGLIEIVFDCGARVILQGPASFLPETARGASLSYGKVTVRAEVAAAKGFAIRTPGMKTVDLGTEFGLEVSPTGIEQVHVFRGEVEVAASSAKGPTTAPRRLVQEQGIEVNPNTRGVKLVANNGERFARSLDDAQKKQHVVAYWRFEDHPVGVLVPESQEGRAPVRGSLDSSINGNDLYTWNAGTQPRFSNDVPSPMVPHSGEANAASLDNGVQPEKAHTRDLFTMSAWSRPSPLDLQAITPLRWTIEASVKAAKMSGGYDVFLVRDGVNVSLRDRKRAPLAFHITPTKHFEITFCDVDGRDYVATAEAVTVAENHWYHVAATSDGESLKLYVDSLDGKGHSLWAVTGLPADGSTALARGVYPTNDPLASSPGAGYPYIWSVGRGYYNSRVGNWFRGWIDEVRICDVALPPSEFLFAPRTSSSVARGQEKAK